MSAEIIDAIILTAQLAAVTTILLLLIGTPLAWWLAHTRHRLRALVQALVALPLVLPPTVIGFYLLLAFAPGTWLADLWYHLFGSKLAFSFSALVIGSLIYSLPFVVQPLQNGFQRVPRNLLEAAATLGATPWDRFRSVVLPLCKNAYLSAATLGFAHTVGEFGIVLMIGGSIPGETRVLSILLYEQVEIMNYQSAHRLAAGLMLFALVVLITVYRGNRRNAQAVMGNTA